MENFNDNIQKLNGEPVENTKITCHRPKYTRQNLIRVSMRSGYIPANDFRQEA